MKLTRLQWFEAGHGTTAVELGIISPDVFVKFIRYQVYQDFLFKKHDHSTAVELTSEQCKCSTWTVREALHFMKGDSFRNTHLDRDERVASAKNAANVRWDKVRRTEMRFAKGQKITP